ncbi:NUDIX domain-containing protein [Kitasatospora sp. GAS204B]|uniref:NUDIX hydrolase n=1 Tax=unclassified Kitasatospora TaxID=2633591 RepID=UPI0024771F88|nr:NUDIX domain-containing protein [Kitasatospora sp. GAS204B]MDH6118047.1 8-oxo-dGTP diphosphatase [Kitasatospora sp. GAS204B]
MTTQRPVIDVMLILERADGRILLAERANTGYADGQLNLPSGKVDHGESVAEAVIREAAEEIGIKLDRDDLRTVHVVHFRNPEGQPRVGWFFAASRWDGEPVNTEPHKCAGLLWVCPEQLPENTVPYNAGGIAAYLDGRPHAIEGW